MPHTKITSIASYASSCKCTIGVEHRFTPRVDGGGSALRTTRREQREKAKSTGREGGLTVTSACNPSKHPGETLNYLRVIARDWAIPLSSTKTAFQFSASTKKAIVQSLNRSSGTRLPSRIIPSRWARVTTSQVNTTRDTR